ncbi:unnamed protein product, partial [Musa acuminata subsp. burmannicoides]
RDGSFLSGDLIIHCLLARLELQWKSTKVSVIHAEHRPSSIMKRVLSSLLPSPFAPPSDGCDRMNQMLTSRILQPHWSPCGQMQSLETRFGKPVGSKEYHLERSGRTEWI